MVSIGIGLLHVYSTRSINNSIPVLGTGNNTGHYYAETCPPYFAQLMTVRREGESVHYLVGIWILNEYNSKVVFLWVFQLLMFDVFFVPIGVPTFITS